MSTHGAPPSQDPTTSAASVLQSLRSGGPGWWAQWDHAAIAQGCAGLPKQVLADVPELAWWRGLAAVMSASADALAWLDLAYHGFQRSNRPTSATVTAHAALAICLLDSGAMTGVSDWHARVDASTPVESAGPLDTLWLRLGAVARVALGQPDTPAAADAADRLQADLMPLQAGLSPHERLLAALVLLEYRFAAQRFEQFDFLANLVEQPPYFEAAAPLLRARWVHMYAFAHYQAGNHDRAEKAWHRALGLARERGLDSLALQTTLGLSRLLLDRGRIDDADRIVESMDPRWGAGRTAQLIQLQQLRARVQLLRGHPARALTTLDEALSLGDAAGMTRSERASCLTDLAQAYVALDRLDDALALLSRLASENTGRDAQVYGCLQHLLQAWLLRFSDPAGSRRALEQGLSLAQSARYTMFFRLVPAMAGSVCALALRAGAAPRFVDEVIRSRNLAAPPEADARWPWPLWLTLLGGFEMRGYGTVETSSTKAQQKPLELLRLLACERNLALGLEAVMTALWPEADDAAARKSFEMAALRLRRLLGDASLLWVGDGRVGLDAARTSSDVQQRRRLVERIEALAMRPGHEGASSTIHDECLVLVERVIAFSRGELLPGLAPAPWMEAERQRCRQDTVRAALAAATVLERTQVGHAERELLEVALRIEPLAESLVRRLMHAHERAGQRGDALRVFESYRQLLGRCGATPGAQIEAQWRALLAMPARPSR